MLFRSASGTLLTSSGSRLPGARSRSRSAFCRWKTPRWWSLHWLAGKASARSVYEHVNVELNDLAPGRQYRIKAAARLPGGKSDSFLPEATGGPVNLKGAPFSGKITLTDAPLAGLARFTGAGLPVDGQLTGTVDFQSATGSTTGGDTATLKLDLKNGSTPGQTPGQTAGANCRGFL